jgi:hypothetical protein
MGKCLNIRSSDVKKMLEFIPNETSLVSIIQMIGEDKATVKNVYNYYINSGIPKVAYGLTGNEQLYKNNNLLNKEGKIKSVDGLTNAQIKNWIDKLNIKSENRGRYEFRLSNTTGGKKILIYPVLKEPKDDDNISEGQLLLFDESAFNKSNNNIKPGVEKLFNENLELANQVYRVLGFNTINESEITYTDEEGNLCAKEGLKSDKFTKGGKWEIIKEFKGASHERGGIDIEIGNGNIKMTGKQGQIKAKFGLVINSNSIK